MVYSDGLISIPAVRTYHPPRYPTPMIAAALATELWTKQKARDDANLDLAKSRSTDDRRRALRLRRRHWDRLTTLRAASLDDCLRFLNQAHDYASPQDPAQ